MNRQIKFLAEEARLERQKLLRIVTRYGGQEELAALERLIILCVAIAAQRCGNTKAAQ